MNQKSTTAPLTPAAIEEIRAKGIADNQPIHNKNQKRVEERIDSLIKFLQANRGHIAGIGVVVIPQMGTSLVDTDSGENSDGLVMRSTVNHGYSEILSAHAKDLTDPRSRNPLAGLLESLR